MKKKTALSFLGLGLIGMVAVPGFGLSKAKAADQDVVCLTCHTPQGVTSLFSLPAMMVLMQREGRHPQVDSNMGNTPTQCMQACHNGSAAPEFYKVLHQGHLLGENNHFVMFYGGRCQDCHSVQPDGTMTVKGISQAAAARP